jgi:hypothetical protein
LHFQKLRSEKKKEENLEPRSIALLRRESCGGVQVERGKHEKKREKEELRKLK